MFTQGQHAFEPVDGSLLVRHAKHRSQDIWRGQDNVLHICAPDSHWIKIVDRCDERIVRILHNVGLYGVYRCRTIGVDNPLITVLVERWRRETHTFHFQTGEATVTLEDVAMIWHLPVRGFPVTGTYWRHTKNTWQALVVDTLGIPVERQKWFGNSLTLGCIRLHLEDTPLNEASEEADVQRWARGFILLMLGGSIFPDGSDNRISMQYIYLLQDLSSAGNYSWGSACLASLYKSLCTACEVGCNTVCGPLVLLQIWAWSRIPAIAPKIRTIAGVNYGPLQLADGGQLPAAPYGARWTLSQRRFTNTVAHFLRPLREIFEDMKGIRQFKWRPYTPEWYELLPGTCTLESFQYSGPLIFYADVEYHRSERVLRQFGVHQDIPPHPPRVEDDLHMISRRGGAGEKNWAAYHAQHIDIWSIGGRRSYVEPSGHDVSHSDEYIAWYHRVSILYISNPALSDLGFRTGAHSWIHYAVNELEQGSQLQDFGVVDRVVESGRMRQERRLQPPWATRQSTAAPSPDAPQQRDDDDALLDEKFTVNALPSMPAN